MDEMFGQGSLGLFSETAPLPPVVLLAFPLVGRGPSNGMEM